MRQRLQTAEGEFEADRVVSIAQILIGDIFPPKQSFNEQQVKDYETRIEELNSEIRGLTSSSELRINDLEAKISDLCKTIASYESSHAKEHSKSGQNKNGPEKRLDDDPVKSLDFDAAIEQISQLKSFIESTARDLNINFNFNGKTWRFGNRVGFGGFNVYSIGNFQKYGFSPASTVNSNSFSRESSKTSWISSKRRTGP